MNVPFSAKLIANESVVINTFDDGESVLLHLDSEQYYGLNDSGTLMWRRLTTTPSIEEAYCSLLDDFDAVGPDELREDLSDLVNDLLDHQLVQLVPTEDGQENDG